jgi:hypothetical protein
MGTTPNPRERDRARPPRAREHPRIVEERHIVDPYDGEQHEVVDEYGRRFWSFRPTPRTQYDVWGFGWFWWLVFWLIIVGLIVWGWGWGY